MALGRLLGLRVLNSGGTPSEATKDIHKILRSRMNELKGEFSDTEGRGVDYRRARDSSQFCGYQEAARGLQGFDPAALRGDLEKRAFWVNLYNVLTIHGIISLGVRRSVQEVPFFFDRVAYRVGPHALSLNDIEHGILRSNRRPPSPLPLPGAPPFGSGDPRRGLMVELDPRIHFALNCGSQSCPPIGIYDAGMLDSQLELAAKSFITGETEILGDRLVLSKIFQWYAKDFGDVRGFVGRYLGRDLQGLSVSYRPYDWSLNHT